MPAVKTSALNPASLLQEFDTLTATQCFRREAWEEIAGCPLSAYTKRNPGCRPRIYLSAGIHGDEPAPPLALLRLLQRGFFDQRATWFLVPLVNPTGFHQGTRENAGGVDLNRDYKDVRTAEVAAHVRWLRAQPNFDLTLCLHEDWEATGFYLYELNPTNRPTLADTMIAAARHLGPIEEAVMIDGRNASAPGIIRPVDDPLMRDNWPESIYLRAHHTTLGYTLETPSLAPLDQRVEMICTAVEQAVKRLLSPTSA